MRVVNGCALVAVLISSAIGCGDSNDGGPKGTATATDHATEMSAAGAGGAQTPTEHKSAGPAEDKLPSAQADCPTFDGDGDYTFGVQGGRQVRIWVDAAKAAASADGGPVIFYWHGTGSGPELEVPRGLGVTTLSDVKEQGGLVAGFYSPMNHADKGKCDECKSNTGNGVWFIEDFNLADEVLACAIKQLHIDTRRIHVSGMSAGGLEATAMIYARSNYLASAAPYSGGEWSVMTPQDASNPVPAMIFHGTYTKDIVTLHFYATSKILFDDIKARGGFAIDCNHGMGHTIPVEGGPAVWQFFQAHPYHTEPSPWENGLPDGLPAYCSPTFTIEAGAAGPFG
jgi:poly(3-hydroxybutyrate) depolymerase